jgi:hypothetical protein
MVIPGILLLLGAVLGGFMMAGGHVGVLAQPSEFVVIIGAAVGSLLIASPGLMKQRVKHVFSAAMKDRIPKRGDYLELLMCQYELFMLARRKGILALEPHLNDPAPPTSSAGTAPSTATTTPARSSPRRCSSSSTARRPTTSRACSTPSSRPRRSRATWARRRSRPSATRYPASASWPPCSASS